MRRQIIIGYFLIMHIPEDHEDADYFRQRQAGIRNLQYIIEEQQLHALFLDDELVDIPRPGNPGILNQPARRQVNLAEGELEDPCIICFSQESNWGLDSCDHRFCQNCIAQLMLAPSLCTLCRRPFQHFFAMF